MFKKLMRSRSFMWGCILAVLLLLYALIHTFFIYTEDAYLKADSVAVAANVAGKVVAVKTGNNSFVTAGDTLLVIDPSPLALSRDVAADNAAQAKTTLAVIGSQIDAARAEIESEVALLHFQKLTLSRYQALYASGGLSKQELDKALSDVAVTSANLLKAKANLITLQKSELSTRATIKTLEKELDLAAYTLSQATINAPESGMVTSFDTNVGDYLKIGDPVFTIVTDNNWRIIANIKEYRLSDIKAGQRVLIHLSTEPFRFYLGQVKSIGRGVARTNASTRLPLQYIDPTVDWIRYDYRFPVTITFDEPPAALYMGADVRIWIVR